MRAHTGSISIHVSNDGAEPVRAHRLSPITLYARIEVVLPKSEAECAFLWAIPVLDFVRESGIAQLVANLGNILG